MKGMYIQVLMHCAGTMSTPPPIDMAYSATVGYSAPDRSLCPLYRTCAARYTNYRYVVYARLILLCGWKGKPILIVEDLPWCNAAPTCRNAALGSLCQLPSSGHVARNNEAASGWRTAMQEGPSLRLYTGCKWQQKRVKSITRKK